MDLVKNVFELVECAYFAKTNQNFEKEAVL